MNRIFILLFCLFLLLLASPSHAGQPVSIDFVPFDVEYEAEDSCAYPLTEYDNGVRFLSLIIDDMGPSTYSDKFIRIKDEPLTLSFLPYAKLLSSQVQMARENGHDVMLHMPMQPFSNKPKEKYMIVESDTPTQIREKLNAAIDNIPDLKGFNNHMGSLITSEPDKMDVILDVALERGLFFVDSKTSAKSVAENMAFDKGVETIGRDVFLDDEDDKLTVYQRLMEAAYKAHKNGYAVAIGHPVKATYTDVKRFIVDYKKRDELQDLQLASIQTVMNLRDCLELRAHEADDISSDRLLDDVISLNYEIMQILADIKE